MLSPLIISILVFSSVFSAAILAMKLGLSLPKAHLTADSQATVKLAMGLVATLTALVLGLLVASAKESYDTNKNELTTVAAKVAFLDRVLFFYGPESTSARESLHQATLHMMNRLWPDSPAQEVQFEPDVASGNALFRSIQSLTPATDDQRALKTLAISSLAELGQTRWLLYQQSGPSTSTLPMTIVVCWIAILFFSFGIFAPTNSTVVVAILIAAVSVAGSVFLILEMEHPFDGLIRVSNQPILNALKAMGK